jgi:DnaK suppressor protein
MMSEHTDIDVAAVKTRLLEIKADLERLAHEHEHDSDIVELDQTTQGRLSRMDALQGQAMALEVARRREAEIRRIDAALARIEDGDYGYCVGCGEEIARKRLDLDPATPNCIDCARGEEA